MTLQEVLQQVLEEGFWHELMSAISSQFFSNLGVFMFFFQLRSS